MNLICAVMISALALGASPSFGREAPFNPKPWLDDLAQMRNALTTRYANLEWAVVDRQANFNDYFARARKRIENASDEGSARAAFDGLIRRLGDGHVEIEWPARPGKRAVSPAGHDVCEDYDSAKEAAPLAGLAPTYEPLITAQSEIFPAGVIASGKYRVGVLKIGLFSPEGTPALCHRALHALSVAAGARCADECTDRIEKWAAARMNEAFIDQLGALKAAKVDVLLIDVAGNGGGTEWAEAAARMLTPVRLKSERVDFVRGTQWQREFSDTETALHKLADTATPEDRAFLLKLSAAVKIREAEASTPCDPAPILRGENSKCPWLGQGFYASGLIDSADPQALSGKSWAPTVFTPMEFAYSEGIWRGPLLVLVDGESWSAAEEFAAVLQDNHAALIIGEPTGGAGCGHTDDSEPFVLTNSGGKLSIPDCARIRADGSNEVRGVLPDLPVQWGRHDGPKLRAGALIAKLPDALSMMEMMRRREHTKVALFPYQSSLCPSAF